jgi:thioesterase domain-containing protein
MALASHATAQDQVAILGLNDTTPRGAATEVAEK